MITDQAKNSSVLSGNSSSSQSIQLLPIGDLQNLLNTGFIPLRAISVGQIDDKNSANSTDFVKGSNNIMQPIKLINASPLISNTSISNGQITPSVFSIENGTLTPVIIATNGSTAPMASLLPSQNNASLLPKFTDPSLNSQALNSAPIKQNLAPKTISNPVKENQKEESADNSKTAEVQIKTNFEEMSLNELKEECRKRKLTVTGTKQKLIERLRSSITLPKTNPTSVKSPDSGVNMDGSPGFFSSKCKNMS